jgi:pyrroloquinoline quinone biosynthesis protein B
MWVRVLGSAAGGGYPQWNCDCPACRAVRDGSRPAHSRTQSSIAVSPDYRQWFLLNASPDIHAQIESFPALRPCAGGGGEAGGESGGEAGESGEGPDCAPDRGVSRAVPVRAVLLTDAELDHTLGLLLLREGRGLEVHATAAAHDTLRDGTSLLRTLEAYCPVDWVRVVPGRDMPLGEGLSYRAFDVPTTKRPRFGSGSTNEEGGNTEGRVVGYRLTDACTGGVLVYLPAVQQLTATVRREFAGCACLLVDGTCWHDEELIRLGASGKTAREMGHLPISGPGGSLEQLSPLPIDRKIYIHINNTNPVLLEDAPERRILEQHGLEIAADGLELQI